MPKMRSKRAIAAVVVALAAVAGGGAAVAATSGGSSSSFLDSVAKHLGVTPKALEDATKAAAIDQVDADLAAGRITKAQADAIKQRIQSGDVPFLGGGRRGFGPPDGFDHHGPGGPGFHGVFGDALDAAASYLDLTQAQLREKLQGGSSLADVAKAQGKDLDGLKQAIIDAATKALDQAVTDKQLTTAQRDEIVSGLKARIDDLVTRTPGARGAFRARRWHA
jgi:hypothetical protein